MSTTLPGGQVHPSLWLVSRGCRLRYFAGAAAVFCTTTELTVMQLLSNRLGLLSHNIDGANLPSSEPNKMAVAMPRIRGLSFILQRQSGQGVQLLLPPSWATRQAGRRLLLLFAKASLAKCQIIGSCNGAVLLALITGMHEK